MTDLTDKWKKGELPKGWYWVEGSRAEGIYAYTAEYLNIMYRPKNSERIIEQVPSYDEWEKLNNACHELEKETACLTVDNVNLKKWRKLAYDAKPIIIAHQNNAKTLAQKLLQVKPELREWLEINFKEYL